MLFASLPSVIELGRSRMPTKFEVEFVNSGFAVSTPGNNCITSLTEVACRWSIA